MNHPNDDPVKAGQRRINLIWEVTQAVIAVSITFATIFRDISPDLMNDAGGILPYAFFLIIGFYFGRTNHQKVGGVGSRDLGR